jgi:hypothetical protein
MAFFFLFKRHGIVNATIDTGGAYELPLSGKKKICQSIIANLSILFFLKKESADLNKLNMHIVDR